MLCVAFFVVSHWATSPTHAEAVRIEQGVLYRSISLDDTLQRDSRRVLLTGAQTAQYLVGGRTALIGGYAFTLPATVYVEGDMLWIPTKDQNLEAGWEPEIRDGPTKTFFEIPVTSERSWFLGEEYRLPRNYRIWVDAGHGGEDQGASANGLVEKDVVLDVARWMANTLEQHPQIETRQTRTKDKYFTLDQRTEMAEKWQADWFVSLHANSAQREGASGIEIFVVGELNDQRVAERLEKYGELDLGGADDTVSLILADLSQNASSQLSFNVANSLHTEIQPIWGGEYRGVKAAPFYVLRNATMPSILFEIGFLTNGEEARKLASPATRASYGRALGQKLAKALATANNGDL
jgi:N-acetylmuramoyl-L-alanine amidase